MSKLENIKEKVATVVQGTLPYLKTAWKWTCVAAVHIALWTKAAYQWAKPHVIAGSKRAYRWFRSLQPRNQLIVAGVTGVLVMGLLWAAAARMPGKVDRSQDVSPTSIAVVAATIEENIEVSDIEVSDIEASVGIPDFIELIGHTDWVRSAVFSPDGQRIATVSGGNDESVRIWDTVSGREIHEITHKNANAPSGDAVIYCVVFSPNGKKIMTTGWEIVRVWDTASGSNLLTLTPPYRAITSAAFSSDNRRIVTLAGTSETVQVWDAESGRELRRFKVDRGDAGDKSLVSFFADGKKIFTSTSSASFWYTETGGRILTISDGNQSIARLSPDGSRVVTVSNGTAKIWSDTVERGSRYYEEALKFSGQELLILKGDKVGEVIFSPDSKKVVTVSREIATVWTVESGEEVCQLVGHDKPITSLNFSPDSKRIVTSSFDLSAKVFDATSGKLLQDLIGHADRVWSADFSPNGKKIVTASSDKTARIWEVD